MPDRNVVSRDEWLEARLAHLTREKEFTRLRDELTRERQQLPWVKMDKEYTFDSAGEKLSLADLFAGRKQLLIYHFMYGPDWDEGCPSCSFWADNYNGIDIHLAHRETTLLAISNTSVENIEAYKKRMGWTFEWVSSLGSDFNRDFHVTFTADEVAKGEMYYNYRHTNFPSTEGPGISVLFRDDAGDIFHTYSCYARGLDMLNGAYHLLDLTPLGRDEEGKGNMHWLRRRDQYED
jgi:predicted dithiol-disulfide oxidoreductase (DUF899 family)